MAALACFCMAIAGTGTASAQSVRSIDPNTAIDADLNTPHTTTPTTTPSTTATTPASRTTATSTAAGTSSGTTGNWTTEGLEQGNAASTASTAAPSAAGTVSDTAAARNQTFQRDDLIGAAEGVFGRGAEGLAGIIERILREQGEPNGYIVGREASGALVFGLRYGSGTLHHKVEGTQPVYWTGPSVGFDAGANAGSTFVLVYNLYDTADLFHRYPAGEGAAYLVGGFNASYLRRGDVVLIPVRLGVGARLGVNVGYMKFSQRQRWLPF